MNTAVQAEETEQLRARLRHMAEDHASLQLVVHLIEHLNPLPGLDNMVSAMLASIVETIGGTNIKIYYWIEKELHYADFFGEQKVLGGIDDALVAEVARTRAFRELDAVSDDALLQGDIVPGAWTWGFPLLVGQELIGIVKLENLHISGASLRKYLPIFFSHAALILGNEIRSHLRRKIEAALLESESRFRRMVKDMPMPLGLVLQNGTIQYVNDRFEQLLGYTLEDIPTIDVWWRLAYPDPAYRQWAIATWEAAIQAAARSGGDIQAREYQVACKNGDMRTMEISGVLLGEDCLATFVDLTVRKQAEAELERYRHQLEQLVDERTVQLVQARDAAEFANRAKSVFLSNMSHELRTPLNSILGFAQLMECDERLPADARRNIETVNRAGRHLLSLINDVLEISRIEAGRATIQNAAFDLPETLAAVEEMIRLRAEGKGLAFTVELSGKLPHYVYGDAHRLRQVLLNLLGNAVKYTDQGQISLQLAPSDDSIHFAVKDSGAGISPEEQLQIFQPFYQTEAGIAKGEGTGLGLTISREYVRLMGGELLVSSRQGQGSAFSFTLPLPEADTPAASVEQRRVLQLEPGQPAVRVLVAEDNPDNQALIRLLLENVGFEVQIAENGQRAIELFQSWQPDFIWMDMRMPVLDGYAATQAIRALPGGARVKIVALTASAFQENREAILAAGCDNMLAKPLDAARLYGVMGELLGVRYRYADEPVAVSAAAEPIGTDFSALPDALRQELLAAAELLDPEAVQGIAERLLVDYPEQARRVAELADAYRFDVIAALAAAKG